MGAYTALDSGITTLRDESRIQNSPDHTGQAIAALQDSGISAVDCVLSAPPTADLPEGHARGPLLAGSDYPIPATPTLSQIM